MRIFPSAFIYRGLCVCINTWYSIKALHFMCACEWWGNGFQNTYFDYCYPWLLRSRKVSGGFFRPNLGHLLHIRFFGCVIIIWLSKILIFTCAESDIRPTIYQTPLVVYKVKAIICDFFGGLNLIHKFWKYGLPCIKYLIFLAAISNKCLYHNKNIFTIRA